MQLVRIEVNIVGRARIQSELELPDGTSDFDVLRAIDEEINKKLHIESLASRNEPEGDPEELEQPAIAEEHVLFMKFTPQEFSRGIRFNADIGPTWIDVTQEFHKLDRSVFKDGQYDPHQVGMLAQFAKAPAWVHQWMGPFSIEVEAAIARYSHL